MGFLAIKCHRKSLCPRGTKSRPPKTKQKQIFSLTPMTFFLFLVARTSDMRSTLRKFLSVWSSIAKRRPRAVEQSPRSYSSCKTGLYSYLLNITSSCFEIYWYHSPLTFYRFWATCSLVIGCCVIHQVYLLWRKIKSIKGKNHSENGGMLKGECAPQPASDRSRSTPRLLTWCMQKECFTSGNGSLLLGTDRELWNKMGPRQTRRSS